MKDRTTRTTSIRLNAADLEWLKANNIEFSKELRYAFEDFVKIKRYEVAVKQGRLIEAQAPEADEKTAA